VHAHIVSLDLMPTSLTSFEAEVLSSLVTGDPEEAALRNQIANAQVVSRKHTGVGLYVNFEVSTGATRLRTSNRYIEETPKMHIQHPELEAGAGALLWFKNGWLVTLECYTYAGDKWPSDESRFSIRPHEIA